MSAQSAEVVALPSSRRVPGAAPVHKLRVMEECRRRIQAREVRRTGIAVLGYIAECIDKETGLATLRLRTIAEATTYSRGEVGKAVQELVAAGLVERVSNRRGNECLAASFRLAGPATGEQQTHRPQAMGSSPAGDTSRAVENPFPNGLNPNGLSHNRRNDDLACPAIDWGVLAEWLAIHGRYSRWAPGPGDAYLLAKEDLERWRQRRGDWAVVAAMAVAKAGNGGRGWFGDYLIKRLGEMLGDS